MDKTCDKVNTVAKENNAVWLVVCTPPGCSPQDAELKALAARSRFRVKILTTLNGATVEMRKYSRSRKIRMFREYLLTSNEDVVVCTDANDVLANPGRPDEVMELLSDELVVGGDTSCWVGAPCDQATLDVVTRVHCGIGAASTASGTGRRSASTSRRSGSRSATRRDSESRSST